MTTADDDEIILEARTEVSPLIALPLAHFARVVRYALTHGCDIIKVQICRTNRAEELSK